MCPKECLKIKDKLPILKDQEILSSKKPTPISRFSWKKWQSLGTLGLHHQTAVGNRNGIRSWSLWFHFHQMARLDQLNLGALPLPHPCRSSCLIFLGHFFIIALSPCWTLAGTHSLALETASEINLSAISTSWKVSRRSSPTPNGEWSEESSYSNLCQPGQVQCHLN